MSISAKDVQDLRKRTGAGMMDCKRALEEAKGDAEQAIKLLKEWGIAKAAKKSGREASEGVLVAIISSDKKKGGLIEVNCETDFVAKTDEFKAFSKHIAEVIFQKGFNKQDEFDDAATNLLKEGISKFGENMLINSIKRIEGKTAVCSYIHSNFKNGSIIALETEGNVAEADLKELGTNLAVHTSANTVIAVSKDNIDPKILEAKKAEYAEEIKKQGKPANIVAKIVEGKLAKFYKDETLYAQPYLKNEEITVDEYISSVAKKSGAKIKVSGFIKTIIGE